MEALQAVFPMLIGVALAAVLMVLLVGTISMLRGGEFNRRWQDKVTRTREILELIQEI